MIPLKKSERMLYFKKNNFKNEDILPLVVEHVLKYKKMNDNLDTSKRVWYNDMNHPVISPILGEVIYWFVEKIVCGHKFKNYTEDWKDDFRSAGYNAMCRYLHNFNIEYSNVVGYMHNSIERSVVQELLRKKSYSSHREECSIDMLSDDIRYSVSIDVELF